MAPIISREPSILEPPDPPDLLSPSPPLAPPPPWLDSPPLVLSSPLPASLASPQPPRRRPDPDRKTFQISVKPSPLQLTLQALSPQLTVQPPLLPPSLEPPLMVVMSLVSPPLRSTSSSRRSMSSDWSPPSLQISERPLLVWSLTLSPLLDVVYPLLSQYTDPIMVWKSIELRGWKDSEFSDDDILMFECYCVVSRLSVAALCRFLLWHSSVQPLTYRPLCRIFKHSLVLSPYLFVVKISAFITSALERECVRCSFRGWWCLSVDLPPKPPEPPDPPDYITSLVRSIGSWSFAVLTLLIFGDMSIVTACISTTSTPLANHDLTASFSGSILLVHWIVWRVTCLCPIARFILFRLKLVSSHLPLYEDRFTLPLYEDRFTLPLYEDCFTLPLYEEFETLPLYEDFVTLPLYEDFGSFKEFVTFLCSLFVLNSCVTRRVIKGSFDRCLYASVAILERGNCALVAVPISGVRSSAQGVILLNNSIVQEIRGLLEDFYLFKCYVAIIFLCFSTLVVVVVSSYAIMAMLFGNTYSVFGD